MHDRQPLNGIENRCDMAQYLLEYCGVASLASFSIVEVQSGCRRYFKVRYLGMTDGLQLSKSVSF
jgi:hypothetical protein